MPKATVLGHPLHPILIAAPAALIPFGFILDAMYRSTRNDSYANAAYYSLTGALVGGAAAAGAGLMDYLTIESQTEIKRTANLHAMLNSGAMAATAANLLMRRNKPQHAGGSLALSAIATVGVLVSGWFGGRMVYEQGMRVRGVSPAEVERAREMKLPGDEAMEHAMLRAERLVPAAGPHIG